MTNQEHFYLIGKCLTLEEHPEFIPELIRYCNEDLINWEHFVYVCSDHLVLPAIYLQFKSNGILKYLPEELSVHLENIYSLNVQRNTLILKQLHQITQLLNSRNIYPIFLKGSGNLIDGVYSDIGERILGDIDFLVPEKEYLLSGQLFEDEGYSTGIEIMPHVDFNSLKHYPRLTHPDYVASVEIHRIPVNEDFLKYYNAGLIDREKKINDSIPGCFVVSDKHKVIHNFIHSQLSNRGHVYGIISYRDLYDIYLFSKRIDIKEIQLFAEYKRKAIAYFVFAEKVFDLPGRFCAKSNLSAKVLLKKHTLNLNSRLFYRIHRNVVYFKWQFFDRYFGLLINAMYSKKNRQSIAKRLNNPKWYKSHMERYKDFFSNKHN